MQTKGSYKALLGKDVLPEQIALSAEDDADAQKAEWETKVQRRNQQIDKI